MPDQDEQARIRDHFAATPGVAEHALRAHNQLDNARAYGHEGAEADARAELAALGYTPRDERERAEAAQARKDAAAARKDERQASTAAPEGRTASPPGKQTTAKPAAKKG